MNIEQIAALVFMLTAGIKDIAENYGLKISGNTTLLISGVFAIILVVGTDYALRNNLLSKELLTLVSAVFAMIGAAGLNKTAKIVGGLVTRNDIPKK